MENSGIVFVIDDDAAIRKSLELLLHSVGLPVKSYSSAEDFLNAFEDSGPACIILDVRMPGMSGLQLQRCLKERECGIPVIIVTGHGDVPIAVRAMKDGAMEFLEKPYSKQLLLDHVRAALERDQARRERDFERLAVEERLGLLTKRETEVMKLITAGKFSKEVALKLGISKKTVDVHRANIMHKLKAESLAELVRLDLKAQPSEK